MIYPRWIPKAALDPRQGQVSLPFILVIGSVMIAIITGLVFVSVYEALSVTQERSIVTARFLLETGFQDAALKVAKDKTYTNTGGYTLTLNDGNINVGSITVKVFKDNPVAGKTKIALTAQPTSIISVTKQAEAVLVIDALGNLSIDYFQEL